MRWTPGEPSRNVEDRRGAGGGVVPMGIGGAIILLMLGLLFGRDFIGNRDTGLPQSQAANGEVAQIQQSPQEEHLARFVNVIVDDIQDSTWRKILPGYRDAKLVLYRDLTPTACSLGRSAAGP